MAGPDGNLWFADHGATGAIGRITPSGAIHEFTTGPGTTLTGAAAESGNEGAAGVVIVAEAPPEFVTVIVAVNESPSGSVCGMARVAESCEGVCTVTGDDVFGVAVMALWSVESVPLAFAVSVREPAALGV